MKHQQLTLSWTKPTTNGIHAEERTAFETTVNIYEKQDIKVAPPLMQSMEILSALWSISVTLIGMGKNNYHKGLQTSAGLIPTLWHK